MRRLSSIILAFALMGCSAQQAYESSPRASVRRAALSKPTLGIGGDSLTQVTFENGTTCSAAHLSPVWYMAMDITMCADKDGKETYHDTQITSAFTIGIAVIGAAISILALKL